jgi:hypothetical protein
MSKIVQAVNSMIANSSKIIDVISDSNTYYFMYNNKYKWSIYFSSDSNAYLLNYYSSKMPLNEIAQMPGEEWQYFTDYICYSTKEIGTKEAFSTFQELYRIVKEKLLGIDTVLNDIIGDFGTTTEGQ